jgi:hypothetical protein
MQFTTWIEADVPWVGCRTFRGRGLRVAQEFSGDRQGQSGVRVERPVGVPEVVESEPLDPCDDRAPPRACRLMSLPSLVVA